MLFLFNLLSNILSDASHFVPFSVLGELRFVRNQTGNGQCLHF